MQSGILKTFVLAAIVLGGALTAHAGDFVVISNPSLPVAEVSKDDLRLVFLGDKTLLGGSGVEPVLADHGAAHDSFLKECVGKSDTALRNYLKGLVFTGKISMPKSLASDAAIVQYVAKTKGAIGYVSAAAAAGGVKTLSLK